MRADTVPVAADIDPGHHITTEIFGLTVNADTLWSTGIAGAIVIGLGLWMRVKITSKVPSKIQVFWEAITDSVTRQVEASLGKVNPFVVPLAISLFVFILIANWLHTIPSDHKLVAPTADVNLTYALALLVIVGVHTYSIRQRGWGGYVKHYFQPNPLMFPINLIEELVKPFTLALRLFGNIFSGGIMVLLIGLLPSYLLWGPNAAWKLFDLFIGLIQAFIFALLTILYFGMAAAPHLEERADEEEKPADEEEKPADEEEKRAEAEPQLEGAH
jgi:F-type H+-transporting ATPase subunit a